MYPATVNRAHGFVVERPMSPDDKWWQHSAACLPACSTATAPVWRTRLQSLNVSSLTLNDNALIYWRSGTVAPRRLATEILSEVVGVTCGWRQWREAGYNWRPRGRAILPRHLPAQPRLGCDSGVTAKQQDLSPRDTMDTILSDQRRIIVIVLGR